MCRNCCETPHFDRNARCPIVNLCRGREPRKSRESCKMPSISRLKFLQSVCELSKQTDQASVIGLRVCSMWLQWDYAAPEYHETALQPDPSFCFLVHLPSYTTKQLEIYMGNFVILGMRPPQSSDEHIPLTLLSTILLPRPTYIEFVT